MLRVMSITAALVLGLAGAASATTLSISNVTGAWSDVTGTPTRLNGGGTNAINWGTPFTRVNVQSGYVFNGINGSGIAADTDFQFGTFTHNNFVIDRGTSITGAKLSVSLDASFDGGPLTRITQVFDFTHEETPNTGACSYGGSNNVGVNVNGCADRVTATVNPTMSDKFIVGGQEITLSLTGFLVGRTPFSSFLTVEQRSNQAILLARYTVKDINPPPPPPSPVPLPASALMLLGALGGLGVVARRRRRT